MIQSPEKLPGDAGQSPCDISGRLVTCRLGELRPHRSYVRHQLTVPASKLSALAERQHLTLLEPLAITQDYVIIDGYARLELARRLNLKTVPCLEYQLSETQALSWLIQRHRRSAGLNDFTRILMALDLEPGLKAMARVNQQTGGRLKGWSNLTKAEEVHVRSEVARIADVSVGNVTKVRQIKELCVPEYIEAPYNREVSIHWAWKMRNSAPEDQLDALGRFRFAKGLTKEIRQRASRRQKPGLPSPVNTGEILSRLTELSSDALATVEVTVLKGPGKEIILTQALARIIGVERLRQWNQSVLYNNS